MASARKQQAQRQHMAQLAARLMSEQGIRDFRIAKQKAAQHLGIDVRNSILPKNSEIETALAEHQRLFAGGSQPARLRAMREAALQAMKLFADFRPRLVGDVLSGLADDHSDIQLHVFAEQSEAFDLFLQGQGIPFEIVERRYRVGRDAHRFYPAFRFAAGEHGFEATLFAAGEIREAPRSLVDGAPMKRASAGQLEQLIADDDIRERLAGL
ncbi:hypothetical protein T31B1_13589 [Salinisphaera sp. T31B1]